MENFTFPDYDYTMYNNTEDQKDIDPNIILMIKNFSIIFYIITFILGIIGNGLVIWIAGFKMKKTVTSLWFLNLAIADFVFDIIFPLQITQWIMDRHWPFGQVMCKIVFTVLFLTVSVITFFMMIVSIDRCVSTMFPMRLQNHRSPKFALKICYLIWSVCFMFSAPNFAFVDIVHDSDNTISYCIPIYADDNDTDTTMQHTMIVIRFVSMVLIPLLALLCYSRIVFQFTKNIIISIPNRPKKVIITIVLCFFCIWLPFQIWPLLSLLNVKINHNIDVIMYNLVYCIGFFISCVNPIVYVFVERDFNKSLFRSTFLLESTFMENDGSDTEPRAIQTVMESEWERYSL